MVVTIAFPFVTVCTGGAAGVGPFIVWVTVVAGEVVRVTTFWPASLLINCDCKSS